LTISRVFVLVLHSFREMNKLATADCQLSSYASLLLCTLAMKGTYSIGHTFTWTTLTYIIIEDPHLVPSFFPGFFLNDRFTRSGQL
jgi:hypothetical protein